jgi:hypothetical protein
MSVVGKEHTTIKLKDPDRLIDAASSLKLYECKQSILILN